VSGPARPASFLTSGLYSQDAKTVGEGDKVLKHILKSSLAIATIGLTLGCSDQTDTPSGNAASDDVAVVDQGYLGIEAWPAIKSPIAQDLEIEERIKSLVAAMSVEEKVGQIIQTEIQHVTPKDIKDYHIGSVLNGGGSLPNRNKYAPPAEWLAMADAFYDASMDTSDGGQAIPIIWGSDAVHGHNNVIGATIFPHNIGLGAMRNPDLMRQVGTVTAREMRVTGIDWTFAPTLAVVQNDRWGRTYESYSEDPAVVRSYAGELVYGLQGVPGTPEFLDVNHVVATAKHWVGDGGTEGGDDQGDTAISEAELRDIHAQGYVSALEAGVQTAMASFSSWNDKKMHGHDYMINGVLKERMGLDGLVVGDWNGHGQVKGCTNASCAASLNAGVDLFMVIEDWKELYNNTLASVNSGEVTMERLDDAVSRVLRVKLRAGLFEKGRPSDRGIAGQDGIIGSADHRAVSRQAVQESLVLLKNIGGLLPLKMDQNILLAGDGADSMQKQTGGWTITWQGTGNKNSDFPGGTTIFDGFKALMEDSDGSVTFSEDGSYSERPDVAVVVFGEDPYAEFQGDIENLEFQPGDKQALALIQSFTADDIPVVAVFLSGRPMWVSPELNASDAFVAAWLPGSEGVGVADVLLADAEGAPRNDFKGTLSFSWPKNPLQEVLNPHHADYDPLFALGHGLTYASGEEGMSDIPLDVVGVQQGKTESIMLHHGRPLAPWEVYISTETAEAAQLLSGPYAAHANGSVSIKTVDMVTQEDTLQVTFTGTEPAEVLIQNSEMDLSTFYDEGVVTLMVSQDALGDGDMRLLVNERPLSIKQRMGSLVGQGWQRITVNMSCFADSAEDLAAVTSPFKIQSDSAATISFGKIEFLIKGTSTLPCE